MNMIYVNRKDGITDKFQLESQNVLIDLNNKLKDKDYSRLISGIQIKEHSELHVVQTPKLLGDFSFHAEVILDEKKTLLAEQINVYFAGYRLATRVYKSKTPKMCVTTLTKIGKCVFKPA